MSGHLNGLLDEIHNLLAANDYHHILGKKHPLQLLPQVSRLYITKVDGEFEGDVFFPKYDDSHWKQVSCESHPKDHSNAFSHHFIVLDRAQ